jgi:hypothetical protein
MSIDIYSIRELEASAGTVGLEELILACWVQVAVRSHTTEEIDVVASTQGGWVFDMGVGAARFEQKPDSLILR